MRITYNLFTDEQLLKLLKRDDAAAFEALYDRYWYRLYVSAYRRIQCKEDTEEAVQNLFESLWRNRQKITIRSSLENYLFTAIRYIVLRILYKKNSMRSSSEVAPEQFIADSSTDESILIDDLSKQIDKLVESLPKKCRNVFELSRYEMKSHKEIAMLMGISEKTVENHLTKALRHIKTNLNHFFLL